MSNVIVKRQERKKELLLKELKIKPIVQTACQKVGIGRATYYRWKEEDHIFASKAEEALEEGCLVINDLAESNLISEIEDKNMTAIIFWLKYHHKSYMHLDRASRIELRKKIDFVID